MRERAREAGGWYSYLNSRLIRFAGPASVGPYETEPEPVRTDRNLDHFGRLSANRRTFQAQAERQRDEIGERVERFGAALFEALAAEVHAKVGVAQRLNDWLAIYRALDPRLSGLAAEASPGATVAALPRKRPAGPVVEYLGEDLPERPRLKAAND